MQKFQYEADLAEGQSVHLAGMSHPRRAIDLARAKAFREAAALIRRDVPGCGGSLPGVGWGDIRQEGTHADPQQQADVDRFADGFHRVILGDHSARTASADGGTDG